MIFFKDKIIEQEGDWIVVGRCLYCENDGSPLKMEKYEGYFEAEELPFWEPEEEHEDEVVPVLWYNINTKEFKFI
jgi:hypothetical protein